MSVSEMQYALRCYRVVQNHRIECLGCKRMTDMKGIVPIDRSDGITIRTYVGIPITLEPVKVGRLRRLYLRLSRLIHNK